MVNSENRLIRFIDGAIVIFMLMFLVSLTNSIFINQLGYFGALLLLLLKSAVLKKNVFSKTGLEWALLLMIAAEILSTVFSVNVSQSIKFVAKFLLLIPIIYTVEAAANNLKSVKMYFKIYAGAALISCLIYLYLSYDYLIYNRFQLEQSGPSPFQYPITASELISFLVMFLFAFAVNEKRNWKIKIMNWLLFGISLAALLAIYKRTGWLAVFVGILFILIYLRKWKILIPLAVVIALVIIYEKNESEIYIYQNRESVLEEIDFIETEGRVKEINFDDNTAIISDYENGLITTSDFKTFTNTKTPSAVTKFFKWGDFYCASLDDSRFVLYKKNENNGFEYISEFLTPGYVNYFASCGSKLYVSDSESGIIIFNNPLDLKDTLLFPNIKGVSGILIDSLSIAFASHKRLEIYSEKDGLPKEKIVDYKHSSSFGLLGKQKDVYLISRAEGLSLLKYENGQLRIIQQIPKINTPYKAAINGDTLYFVSPAKVIFSTVLGNDNLKIISQKDIAYLPTGIFYFNNKIFITHLIQGRLSSFIDIYNPSNATRFALWRAGLKMFLDHPVFGVGNIDLADLYKIYKRPSDKEIQGHMHSNYIHFLVTLGSVGIIAVFVLFFVIFKRLGRLYTENKSIPFASSYILGTMGGIVSFLIAGLTEWNFGDHEIITMVWFSIGLSFAFGKYAKEKTGE